MRINRSNAAEPAQPEPRRPEPQPTAAPKTPPQAPVSESEPSYAEYEEEYEEEEQPRRGHGCLISLIIFVILMVLVAFVGFQVFKGYQELSGGGEMGAEQEFVVEQGSSISAIAGDLKEQGIIEYDWLFKLYAKYSGKASNVQYGTFKVSSGMSYNEIISTLSVQNVFRKTVMVTFPEGTTSVGIAQIMEQNGLCDMQEFLDCANGVDGSDFSQYAFWNQIPDNGRIMKSEGYLFPDTYEFFEDDTVYNYVNTFYREFDAKTAGLMDTIAAKGTTLDDVVILASFIQEEAGKPEEDGKVSACFHNRMESTDPLWSSHILQSNASSYIMQDYENNYLWNSPTAEYMGWVAAGGIPEDILNLYDTYRVSGLPAGPISNPGYAAIEASLNPDEDYLREGYYFFVTGHPNSDVAGQYFYAKTANEHQANVNRAGW